MSFLKSLLWKSNWKHTKLCEEESWGNSCESMMENVGDIVNMANMAMPRQEENNDALFCSSSSNAEATFRLKYLGSAIVEMPSSEQDTADAIKTIVTMSRASSKKLQRVSLSVGLKGMRVRDMATERDQFQVSMYRVSYCSADAIHDHVFAFIATNPNETMECHAFLCPKRKIAQTVALTVAQAFHRAYNVWKLSQLQYSTNKTTDKKRDDENVDEQIERRMLSSTNQSKAASENEKLIDLSSSNNVTKSEGKSWVYFQDEHFLQGETEQSRNLFNKKADVPLKMRYT